MYYSSGVGFLLVNVYVFAFPPTRGVSNNVRMCHSTTVFVAFTPNRLMLFSNVNIHFKVAGPSQCSSVGGQV